MQPKRFIGRCSAQVLRDVRVTLGPDAVILVNRQVGENVEMYAMAAEDMPKFSLPKKQHTSSVASETYPVLFPVLSHNHQGGHFPEVVAVTPKRVVPPIEPAVWAQDHLSSSQQTDTAQSSVPYDAPVLPQSPVILPAPLARDPLAQPTDQPVDLWSHVTSLQDKRSLSTTQGLLQRYYHNSDRSSEPVEQQDTGQLVTRPSSLLPNTRPSFSEPNHPLMEKMMHELAKMRQLLEKQVVDATRHQLSPASSTKGTICRLLSQCGFGSQFCQQLVDTMPGDLPQDQIFYWLHRTIDRRLLVAEHDMVDEGGIIAFVGPTGVGKTTSVAKFAARFVMRHGASAIALVTTDHYRVAAYEQLRVYADILGVPIFAARSAAELSACFRELSDKKAIVIDTMGMSQRDSAVNDLLALFHTASSIVKRYLVLSATATRDNLEDVVQAYQPQLACALSGCIVTKVDEAVRLGCIIDVITRHRLPLMYFADGQSVPEDFHCPDRQYLLSRTLSPSAATKANVFDRVLATRMMSGTKPASNETQAERVLL